MCHAQWTYLTYPRNTNLYQQSEDVSSSSQVDGVRRIAINYDCFECPEVNSCTFNESEPFANFDCAFCNATGMVNGTSSCNVGGAVISILGERLSQWTHGDLTDIATAPNDPLFMFQHANSDRYVMEWQLKNFDQAPYYGYPETGYDDLVRLDDTMAPDYPFEHLFYDEMAELLGDGPYTTRDIWDGTSFLNAPYVYDSVLNMVYQNTTSDDDDDDDDETESETDASSDDDDKKNVTVIVIVVIAVTVTLVAIYLLVTYLRGKSKANSTEKEMAKKNESSSTGDKTNTHAPVQSTASNMSTVDNGEPKV